ncbi:MULTISPECIES: BadF/BadG/BcrA/BcrD ATPase family protein [unclassified Streptomyces]|uniref:N-acetylglucosamine kinase n=1 Tax=unclassified Streptomyces TaxID=2593676 RepID=UPI002481A1AA|nr:MULTISPECIES: BadF/BadG/BcrA/BcrD ATPase family protein [unclassified Streptomyces]MDA5283809.1 ATPase [Streptomyces sp. Isolate_45]MDX2393841.1 ATPase [Streptomyces sp. DK15]
MGVTPAGAAVLAVDAGNSKTDVALIGADGSVLGTGRSGGFQPPRVGVEAAVDVLGQAVAEAAEAAGLPRLRPGAPYAAQVSACLANADLPVEERRLADAVSARGWGAATEVRNDTFAILRAGLPAGDAPRGVAVVCGAGINCVGMLPDGRTARFPAVGMISGDWGGGGGLAEEALWWAARAEDGRGGPTELAVALPGHFGLGSMYELIEALHLGSLARRRVHELVPVLFAVAAAGDPVASSLVERQADEVVAMASVALERLGLLAREVPVLLGGSVLAAGHPQLNDRIGELLARRAPLARISVVAAPPVLGAGLLGLDALGAPPGAHEKLRAHFG